MSVLSSGFWMPLSLAMPASAGPLTNVVAPFEVWMLEAESPQCRASVMYFNASSLDGICSTEYAKWSGTKVHSSAKQKVSKMSPGNSTYLQGHLCCGHHPVFPQHTIQPLLNDQRPTLVRPTDVQPVLSKSL